VAQATLLFLLRVAQATILYY